MERTRIDGIFYYGPSSVYAGTAEQLIGICRTAQRNALANLDGGFAGVTASLLGTYVRFDVMDEESAEQESPAPVAVFGEAAPVCEPVGDR